MNAESDAVDTQEVTIQSAAWLNFDCPVACSQFSFGGPHTHPANLMLRLLARLADKLNARQIVLGQRTTVLRYFGGPVEVAHRVRVFLDSFTRTCTAGIRTCTSLGCPDGQ